jgi:hypothetical protein
MSLHAGVSFSDLTSFGSLKAVRVVLRNGELNFQVQQWDSFSLQRSEMFIVTKAHANVFAPLGAKPVSETTAEQAKAITLLQG